MSVSDCAAIAPPPHAPPTHIHRHTAGIGALIPIVGSADVCTCRVVVCVCVLPGCRYECLCSRRCFSLMTSSSPRGCLVSLPALPVLLLTNGAPRGRRGVMCRVIPSRQEACEALRQWGGGVRLPGVRARGSPALIQVSSLLSVALNPCEMVFAGESSPVWCMRYAHRSVSAEWRDSLDVLAAVLTRCFRSSSFALARSGVTAGVPQEEARGRRRRPRLRPHRRRLLSGGHPDPACLALHPGPPPSPAGPSADAASGLPAQFLLLLLLRLHLGTRPAGGRPQPTRAPGGSAAQAAGRQRPVVRSASTGR